MLLSQVPLRPKRAHALLKKALMLSEIPKALQCSWLTWVSWSLIHTEALLRLAGLMFNAVTLSTIVAVLKALSWPIHHELQLGESRDAPPDMGAYDVKRSTTPPFVVAPGLRWEVQSAVKPQGTISVEERDAIYMARKHLWLCGVIRFKDIFQRVWITRFCHLFERTQTKEFWRVAGPPEYNTCVRETDN